jgi:hypothetical protein
MTSCASATCNTGTNQFVGGSKCDGSGSCLPPGGISCGSYLCKTSGCPTTCATSGDCINGYYCDTTNHCAQQVAPGLACSTATSAPPDQCANGGFCTGGFCCGSSTCPSCYTCAGTGMCNFVGVGLPDPTNTCTVSSPSSCGLNGLCDGLGGCEDYSSATACTVCTGDKSQFLQTHCTGTGTCDSNPADATGTTSCPSMMCDNTLGCQ